MGRNTMAALMAAGVSVRLVESALPVAPSRMPDGAKECARRLRQMEKVKGRRIVRKAFAQ